MNQIDKLEVYELAKYAEKNGMHSKSVILEEFADRIDLMEPVVQALQEMRESDEEFSRQKVQERIDELDDVEYD